MALPSSRRAENAPGRFFVDSSCIACDTCRRFAPETFGGGEDDLAFVARQPAGEAEERRALHALVACPVAAIGAAPRHPLAGAAARDFPLPFDREGGVYACGYAAESSFGAASWLVVRPGGNVLVDAPRFARPLADGVRALGGARWLFLTHKDDVADHARWAAALGCERVLHARDATHRTRGVERLVEGDAPVALADDLLAIPVPGHTAGSMALLHRGRWLFTGDHVWADGDGLGASRAVCWWDWAAQARSMERLLEHPFTVVLPGHGRPWRAASVEGAHAAVRALVARMRR